MKVANLSNIGFEKRLSAKCSLLKDNKPYPCNIYELDPEDDKDYFFDKKNSQDWDDSKFWLVLTYAFHKSFRERVFVMEHGKKCLGVMTLDCTKPKEGVSVGFLETVPENRGESEDKTIKYTGETMLSYLAKACEKAHTSRIVIDNWLDESEGFYIHSNFSKERNNKNESEMYVLDSSRYDYLINQNELHTGRKIKLLA